MSTRRRISPALILMLAVSLSSVIAMAQDVPASATTGGTATAPDSPAQAMLPQAVKDGLVRVVVTSRDPDHPNAASTTSQRWGCIVNGGHVVTTLSQFDNAASVSIRRGDTTTSAVGIVSYLLTANIALVKVDWNGDAPADIPLVDNTLPEHFGKPAALVNHRGSLVSTSMHPPPATAASPIELWIDVDLPLDPQLGGTPVLLDGAVCAIVAGPGTKRSPVPAKSGMTSLRTVRVEVVRALQPGETIGWDRWPERLAKARLASSLATASQRLIVKGRVEESLAKAREAVETDEHCVNGWIQLAWHLAKAEKFDEAIEASKRVLAFAPCNGQGYADLASLQAQAGDLVAAEQNARLGIAYEPDNWSAHFALGGALKSQKRHDEALGELKRALELHDDKDIAAFVREYEQWFARHGTKK